MHFCYRCDCVLVSCLDLRTITENTPTIGWNICISYPINSLVKIKSLLFYILVSRVLWLRVPCVALFRLVPPVTTFDILASVLLPGLNTHSAGRISVCPQWQGTQCFYIVRCEGRGKILTGTDGSRTRGIHAMDSVQSSITGILSLRAELWEFCPAVGFRISRAELLISWQGSWFIRLCIFSLLS
jgi:hypothetical protein